MTLQITLMKKTYLRLCLITLLSVLPVLFLFSIYVFKQQQASYPFLRKLISPIKGVHKLDLKYDSYYFAGNLNGEIYLGNSTASLHVLKVNSLLTDTQHIQIKPNRQDLSTAGHYNLSIDANYFYLLNGVARSILKGRMEDWVARKDSIHSPYFTQSLPLNANTILYRYVSNKTNTNCLRIESIGHKTIKNESAIQKQVDGIFCTDGMLQYNKELKQILYVYYYRNEILVLDTSLKLVRKIKTIDPISRANFKIAKVSSNQSMTFSSPYLLVNANSATWGKYLFVQSNLMGKHEDGDQFKHASAIDVYDLKTSRYVYSFYVPNFNKHPIKQFRVFENGMLTLSDHFILSYEIKLPAY